jgi:hypothetical protein
MNDPRRPDRFGPPQWGSGPAEPPGPRNPPYPDPAYADQAPYASTYGSYVPQWAPNPNETNPTRRLPPQYWQQDQHPPPSGEMPGAPPPPRGPKSPRWLWIAAGAAVLLVVALLVALVIANESVKEETAIPPLPPMPAPTSTSPAPTTSRTPSATPSQTAAPVPPPTSAPSSPTATTGAGLQSVVYNVSGEGRAISITYMDTGDIVQTEFNVSLPWSKQVSLSRSAIRPASVTIVNIGHNVTCSVTVGGVQMRQRTGVGITVCDTSGG